MREGEEKVTGTIAWAKDVSGNFSTPANSKSGVLTVVGANRTVHFTLKGDYLGVTLTAASANGGADSLFTASHTAEAVRFVQAAAAFDRSSTAPMAASSMTDTHSLAASVIYAVPHNVR